MRFLTGPRMRNGSIVVEGAYRQHDHVGRPFGPTHGLRVEFQEHRIDTDALAKHLKWSEEEHQRVIQHLLQMVESGEGRGDKRGIYVDDTPDYKAASVPSDEPTICAYFGMDGDTVRRCDQNAAPGTLHCKAHTPDSETKDEEPVSA